MVSSRKRGRQEMEADEPPKEMGLLQRIRNMWEFAALIQWIFVFGRAVKIDEDMDVEDLEVECMKTYSTVLPEIGLALLKFVSSHRGLTPEIFDEYTRRQYVAKAPERNPYGIEEEPAKFNEFDVFTKIRVLQQLTQWTMGNPDRIRERMEEQKDTDQTIWRIEPFGWDSEDRTYIVLDDNRLYRRTDPFPPPPPAAKPKKNSKKGKAARRASKRRKVSEPVESEAEAIDEADGGEQDEKPQAEYDGFGGMKWECLAVTLDEYNAFVSTIAKSKDPNEKVLRNRIVDDVLPLLEKQEEARKRKQAQKERELLNLEKLAHAKRSSRIAGKMELQKQEEEQRELERKRQAELAMAKKEQEKWQKLEKERESRMQTREQRLNEREARRILHEEELANLSEDSKKIDAGEGRLSERHLKAEIERKKAALEELAEEDEDWIFDCICGAYGQIDDGTHSIACDKCNIWQHSKCVGVSQAEAEREEFTFVCKTCERRAKDAERAKTHPPIKIKLNRPGSSSSPSAPKPNGTPAVVLKPNGNNVNHPPLQKVGGSGPLMATWQPTQYSPPQAIRPPQQAQGMQPHLNGNQHPAMRYDQMKPMAPASSPYSGPYANQPNTAASNISPYAQRPASSHVFSSPHANSPTSLPPPTHPQSYTFINGNSSQPYPPAANGPSTQYTPPHCPAPAPQQQASPSRPASYAQLPISPQPRTVQGERRSSVTLPSPFQNHPTLTPIQKTKLPPNFPTSSSPAYNYNAGTQPTKSSPPQGSPPAQGAGLNQASNLPPSATGLSPTKHSPPRSFSSSFESATPSMLPPVANLTPSPQMQNLTPPVKPSEPVQPRPAGQVFGQ